MPRRKPPAVPITSARPGLSQDVWGRTQRYLLIMLVRTTAFVLAVLLTDGWLRWICIVLAVVLPQVAVIIANGGRENDVATPVPFAPDARRALGPGRPAPIPGAREGR